MSINVKNRLFILFFTVTTYYINGEMKLWMDSKEVISFEFLRTAANADMLINSADWQSRSIDTFTESMNKSDRLRLATRWDFLYILSYVFLFISLTRAILGDAGKPVKIITLLLLIAGLSDVIENILLLQILNGSRGLYPAAMFCFATLKFCLLILSLVWIFFAVTGKLIKK